MSRSNQTETVNPAFRFLEWNGEKGLIKFYDKQLERKVEIDPKLTFILLDQLSTIKGWNDASESGVYSNEVRDLSKDPLIVKSFKGGVIANGLYSQIKEKIFANGGHFTANLYIAIKDNNELKIASLQLKGAALNAWIEFVSKNRKAIYQKAITIKDIQQGTKGRVNFFTPVFSISEISEETNNIAKSLDIELQDYLSKYLSKKLETPEPEPVQPEPVQQTQSFDDLPF